MMSKSKFSSLLKGKSVPNLPSYSTPWGKHDDKLWNAVKQQNLKQVKSLLSKSSVTATKLGPQGKSVFHLACEIGNETIIDAILAVTQDVNDTTIQGVTALQRAAAKGNTSTVEKLLKKQANVDQRDCDGMSALHHACFGQHQDCVKVLLSKNADPNATEQSGKTPLFYSAHLGHMDICSWLLDKGAVVNCQDKDNVTPLMLAAKEGHKNVCELLLRRGANPELVDRNGKRAVDYAFKHLQVQELLARLPVKAEETSSHRGSVSLGGSRSQLHDISETIPKTPVYVGASVMCDDETISRADVHSIHSMDDSLLSNRPPSPVIDRHIVASRAEQAYKELKQQHDQLTEVYTSLSIENLKLRDKVEALQRKFMEKQDREHQEVQNLQEQVEKLRKKVEGYESHHQTHVTESGKFPTVIEKNDIVASDHQRNDGLDIPGDEYKVSDHEKKVSDENQLIEILRSQVHTLRSENEQLRHAVKLPNGDLESPYEESIKGQGKMILSEREHFEKQIAQLQQQLDKPHMNRVNDQELLHQNKTLAANVDSLRQMVASLQEELEIAKREPLTEAQRLDIILAASRNFEEVNFDEEGFVEGRDMTKEEFLQAQNQQLKTQCGLLAEELEKLRATLDAILKAGDNLQADYDHLATEKDGLQDELERTLKEKREIISENELLLIDNNELHDNLKNIIHELEKIQDKYQTAQAENEELKRSVTVASKVGEVARLLEERDALQQKCIDLDTNFQRLQHDHSILLEEVQSLNESVGHMSTQRNQLAADLEELEPICQQHEALQQEYNQLELEFADLLKDKEALEQQVSNNNTVDKETGAVKAPNMSSLESTIKQLVDERQQLEGSMSSMETTIKHLTEERQQLEGSMSSMESAIKHLTEERQQLKEEKQQLEDVVKVISKHNVTIEDKLSELEKSLEEARATSELHKSENMRVMDGVSSKDDELRKYQEEVADLSKQIVELTIEIEDWEKKHEETVTTYRTHLLSAVQGHMDPDVKDALYHIIELRSMEQFC